jgi:hypothetical protein
VRPHEYLYWEFHEGGFSQAVRMGQWKGVRPKQGRPLELYDLAGDIGETTNIAAGHPDIVAKIEGLFSSSRTDSPHWPVKAVAK